MNAELARQLKEMGFPLILFPYEVRNPDYHPYITYKGEMYCIPTLLELIKACGDKFYGLHKLVDGQWLAFMYDVDDSTRQVEVYAQTPEEAVARLWLSLNDE